MNVRIDYKAKTGVLEKQLYRLSLREFHLLRTFLRLSAPEGEPRVDDETISVLSSLQDAPTAIDADVVSERYSKSALVEQVGGDSYAYHATVDEELASDDSIANREPFIHEATHHGDGDGDGYSSSFDDESEAFVRHSQRSRLHNVSYMEDESAHNSEGSVHSDELAQRELGIQGKWQDVWQYVMRRMVRLSISKMLWFHGRV